MGKVGTFRCGTVPDTRSAHAALDFFAEQKALMLAARGCPNGFDAPGMMDFYHEVLARSHGLHEPLLEMAELSVGGVTRAVIGTAVHRNCVNACLIAFARDELTPHSPGQVLIFRHIAEACERGMATYDMGVGYEEYKTHWCETLHELTDTYAAFTTLGTAAVTAARLGQATKERMRQHQPLWRQLKSAQTYLSRLTAARAR